MKLIWNVYKNDFNSREIEKFNIFEHGRFNEDVQKHLKKCKTKEEFADEVRRDLMYYFWSKCEYEIVITSWPPHITTQELDKLNAEYEETLNKYNREPYRLYANLDVGKKVDIYEQVMMNYEAFVDYVWNHKKTKL